MKSLVFASRNIKELTRDPLSWIFCLGFPLIMLMLMTVINESIPPEAEMTLFRIEKLAPGISVFGLTFVMLFASMLISGDRKDAFLLRVFTSPMKPWEYILGYILPLMALSAGQLAVTAAASYIMGAVSGTFLNIGNMLFAIAASIPSVIMFIGFGLLFGALLTKNAAPGISSVIISLSGMLGGIWMDVEAIGGTLGTICNILPFYHCVKAARLAYSGDFIESLSQSGIVLMWALAVTVLAVIVFRRKMRF